MSDLDHRDLHSARPDRLRQGDGGPGAGIADALARMRMPLGFLFGGAVLWLARPTANSLLIGGLIGCVGESLRIWAAGHISKSREVTVSGPYHWFAHPLYVGSAIMGAGLAVAAASALAAACIATCLAVTLTAAVTSEEAFLRRKFGDRYDEYRRSRGGAQQGGEVSRRFSLDRAIANHEHRTLAGFAVVVLLLVLKATYNGFSDGPPH